MLRLILFFAAGLRTLTDEELVFIFPLYRTRGKIWYAYFHIMTQQTALAVLKTGANVFLTGEPGSGKTFVINQYVAWLEACGLSVAVTASTGIAATHIGGLTIHSWSGIGARDTLSPTDLEIITTRERLVKRIKRTHVLIIDEISMLDGQLFASVELICRTIRANNEPFGGLQVVCVGDFFQLPPVTRGNEVRRYAFASQAWQRSRFLTCYLSEQHRQEDTMLLSLLSAIRQGEVEEEHYTLLGEQTDIAYEGIEPTRLYTHNSDVDNVNAEKLKALTGKNRAFQMQSKGNKALVENLVRNCLSPSVLYLKEEAMVMCTKNNFEAGYVNGTLARVIDFTNAGYPVIETTDKRKITIEPVAWEVIDDGKVMAKIEQLPLRLAWAITIHKSQGMSLDAAEVDLSRSFVYGQGYVALSRVRTLGGLKVLGLNPNALQVDPVVIQADAQFKAESEAAEDTFGAMTESDLEDYHQKFVTARGGRYVKEAAAQKNDQGARLKRESTYQETKKLLVTGYSIAEVAKQRSLSPTTIVTHIEQLVTTGEMDQKELRAVIAHERPSPHAHKNIYEALDTYTPKALKPIYEATGGEFDYLLIRLYRALYLRERENSTP